MGYAARNDAEEVLNPDVGIHWAWMAALAAGGLVASTSSAAVGIGGGLLVMPLLSLWLPPQEVVAYTTPMFLASTMVNFWRYRRQIDKRTVLYLTPGVLVGIVAGAHLLRAESPTTIRWIMGAIAIVFAGQEVYRLISHRPVRRLPVWTALPMTLVAGVASALTNIGGTIVSLAMLGLNLSPSVFVGTLNAVMMGMSLLKLGLFAGNGLLGWQGVLWALPSIPAIILGSWAGQQLNHRFSPLIFRWVMVTIIGASAVLLVGGV